MNLYTCCPKCQTTFRVGTPQLQASGGQVRCGFCSQVFDAFASLTAQEPAAQAAPEPGHDPSRAEPPASHPVAPGVIPAVSPARVDPAASLYEWEFRMPAARRHTGLWITLSVGLVFLLAVQAAYAFRAEISVALPQTRPMFLDLCRRLGCNMTPPGFSTYLNIEASDLKALDAGAANEIELSLVVRNRAPVELPQPAFELTLTDPHDLAIARRVFLPRDYATGSASASIRAGGELPVHLYMSTGEVRAAGYRLYLFYP